MRLGFSLPTAGDWATPENQIRVAREAEALGYHSLWVFQRLLYALEPKNEYPPIPGKVWPKPFERVFDPIVTLAYVAAATTRIRLGTSVLIMPFYTPVVLAKQLATLDVLSGGRLNVGLGIGWSEDEYEAVGVPFKQRGRRGDEFLRCLDAIWTQSIVEFQGEFYRVPRCRVEPKPVQKPRPPITVGGYGSTAVRRAVELADGFNGGNYLWRKWLRWSAKCGRPHPRAARTRACSILSAAVTTTSTMRRRARIADRCGAPSTRFVKTLLAIPMLASLSCSSKPTSIPECASTGCSR
jgi:probable F420-dependent oxidoreductase